MKLPLPTSRTALLAVASVAILVYANSVSSELVGDDLELIPHRTTVQDPDTGAYYYAARVGLDQQYLDPSRNKLPIQAGMPLVGDIKGEKRNLLQYIIQPFTRTLGSAFRESN